MNLRHALGMTLLLAALIIMIWIGIRMFPDILAGTFTIENFYTTKEELGIAFLMTLAGKYALHDTDDN